MKPYDPNNPAHGGRIPPDIKIEMAMERALMRLVTRGATREQLHDYVDRVCNWRESEVSP